MKPFIQNHQFNLIRREVTLLQKQVHGIVDRDVELAVRVGVEEKVKNSFNSLTEMQERQLAPIFSLKTEEERERYLQNLRPYRIAFPSITQTDLKQIFSKTKKLKLPSLKNTDFQSLTYLGWKDIGSSKQYLLYKLDGKLIGVEGRYVILTKKNICQVCHRFGDVALVTAQKKFKKLNENDKAFGKYMCYDSKDCNQFIQRLEPLESFLRQIVAPR
ncbi:FusB/FusC family EF-G-binding protein [Jeotgalibacillus soli]|uniref:Fibronectin-binding protein n=1 Tax=Jeotgalibacillus soli TaxID=889306 RepID=A0A0C2SDL0_9BACL|nr:elongation factor G-binding protein [Jeotgalibacillus soli]KIL52029.1 hypothetical protein KP78_03990 [Jeotgalibacillus soli]